MALNINGKTPKKILYNGLNVAKLIYNGVLVWMEKVLTLLTGYPITLTNSVGDDLVDYKVYGESVQDGEPTPDTPIEIESVGDKTVNMLNYSTYATRTNQGVTFTPNNDGSIIANGTTTFTLIQYTINTSLDLSTLETGVEYYCSCGADKDETDLRYYLFFTIKNETTGAIRYFSSSGENTKKFTLEEGEVASGLQIRINIPSGTPTLIDNVVFKPIICKASEYVGFEPYGYKIPVKVRGKNIMPLNTYVNSSVWATQIIVMSELLKNMKAGKRYTISADFICESVPVGVDSTTIGFQFVKKNATSMIALTHAYRISLGEKVHISRTFTLPEDTNIDSYYGLYGYMNYSSTAKTGCGGRIENIQIEEGNEETEYTPYIGSITTNIYIDEPLRKIGDYADYIDFEKGLVIRKIYQGQLIDVIKSSMGSQYANGLCRRQGTVKPMADYSIAPMSNCLKGNKVLNAYANNISFVSAYSNGYVYLNASDVGLEAVDTTISNTEIGTAINNYITEHNIDLVYVLAEPNDTEIIELPNIPTHKGTTIIELDTTIQPSNMEVQYYAKGV